MPNDPIIVEYAAEFKRNLRKLAKRYRHIRTDLDETLENIRSGLFPGARLSGTGSVYFKVRVQNSDIKKGKSAGYRLIYERVSMSEVLLLTLYSKSDQADISTKELRRIAHEESRDL